MRTIGYCLAALAGGLLVGAAAGWLRMRDHAGPGPAPQLAGVEAAAADRVAPPLFADLPSGPTAAAASAGQDNAGVPPAGAAAGGATPPNGETAEPAVLVVPHGAGFFAELDLAAAGLPSVPIYAGALARDGLAQPAQVMKAGKIGTLRGPLAKVELLHFGFQRDAQASVAHVRSAEGLEGLVVLRQPRKGAADLVIAVRPLSAPGDAPP